MAYSCTRYWVAASTKNGNFRKFRALGEISSIRKLDLWHQFVALESYLYKIRTIEPWQISVLMYNCPNCGWRSCGISPCHGCAFTVDLISEFHQIIRSIAFIVHVHLRLFLPVTACYLPDPRGSGWFIKQRKLPVIFFACLSGRSGK